MSYHRGHNKKIKYFELYLYALMLTLFLYYLLLVLLIMIELLHIFSYIDKNLNNLLIKGDVIYI